MAFVEPVLEPRPEGGQVVVTRFECGGLLQLAYLCALHMKVKREVRRHARGLVASRALVDWRRHTLVSVTLWDDLDSVYSMGAVHAHIAASRLPPRMGVRTACGIFCFVGDWRRVMFGAPHVGRSPLRPLAHDEPVAR